MKKAIIIGYKGQDGGYLFENLTNKGYAVIGVGKEDIKGEHASRLDRLDITDQAQVLNFIQDNKPDEIYYLAAYHHSSEDSALLSEKELFEKSFSVNVSGLLNVLEAVREKSNGSKVFYAGSSHVFGSPAQSPQDETTPYKPNCVYGITKTAGIHLCQFYREHYGLFVSVGILYNHESSRRAEKYLSRRIIAGAAAIKNGALGKLKVGDLSAQIDWGYAPDYVDAMHQILQGAQGEEFIVSSGELHTVREFIEGVFKRLELDWKLYVEEDKSLLKKKQKVNLFGNNQKLIAKTGWNPSVDFDGLINHLVSKSYEKAADPNIYSNL